MKDSVRGGVALSAAVWLVLASFPGISLSGPFPQGGQKRDLTRLHARLAQEVRHQLVLLPYYGVFDDLAFEIKDVDTVVLMGEVTRPTLKSGAENVVKSIEGVGKIINNIEVLPLSPSDDRIRLETYRAIFTKPGLDLYAMRAVPPIHIIVKNGNITLKGIVATESDKNLAGIAARGIPGTFQVTNDLVAEK